MSTNPPLRILLIEDNPGDARYLEELLREATEFVAGVPTESHVVEQPVPASDQQPTLLHELSLEAGIGRLDDEFDVVLLDLNLPDSRGLDTLSTLDDHTDAPIVVLTGVQDRETGLEAIRQGADDYLVKDEINSDLLIRSVHHAIERRAHERELRQYETLLERSTDVNAILDPDGTIRYITPPVEYVLGYEPKAMVGDNAFSYIHPEDRAEMERSLESVIQREDMPPAEFRIQDANGSWVILEVRGRNLLDDPLVKGVVVYTRDITERVEREQRLEQFASVVSHDLRNPLGIAQMYLQEVRKRGDPEDIESVERALGRMDTLIDTLLTLAREGEAIDEPETVSLPRIIDNAWWQVDTEASSIHVDDDLGTVRADPERLQTVFENLFRNAVEHGGASVDVRIEWLGDGFAVEDSGPGIPTDQREEVFTFGFSKGGGTGTGLAIIGEIVEAHGWDIEVREGADGGARFEIRGVDETASA